MQAGDPIWVDVNGDYIIDDKDKVVVGNSQPRLTGGFPTIITTILVRQTIISDFQLNMKSHIRNNKTI